MALTRRGRRRAGQAALPVRPLLARMILSPPPLGAQSELSMIHSPTGETGPSERLLDITHDAVARARNISLEHISSRMSGPPFWPDVWPGEHYRLLSALAQTIQATTVVEIGTATGLSALALLDGLATGARLASFDIAPWQELPDTMLIPADFEDGRLSHHVADLSDPVVARAHHELLGQADLIFIDAAKDGRMEHALLANLASVEYARTPIVVLDDVRQWNMLSLWHELRFPKLDVTSFGHWSGTGLIELADQRHSSRYR